MEPEVQRKLAREMTKHREERNRLHQSKRYASEKFHTGYLEGMARAIEVAYDFTVMHETRLLATKMQRGEET